MLPEVGYAVESSTLCKISIMHVCTGIIHGSEEAQYQREKLPRHGTFPKLNYQRNQMTKELSINSLIWIQIWGLPEEPWVDQGHGCQLCVKPVPGLSFTLGLLCHAAHVKCSCGVLTAQDVPCPRTCLLPSAFSAHTSNSHSTKAHTVA